MKGWTCPRDNRDQHEPRAEFELKPAAARFLVVHAVILQQHAPAYRVVARESARTLSRRGTRRGRVRATLDEGWQICELDSPTSVEARWGIETVIGWWRRLSAAPVHKTDNVLLKIRPCRHRPRDNRDQHEP